MRPPLHLILLAGGQGVRAARGEGLPKQFQPTGQGLLFSVSLREFADLVSSVTVVVPTAWREIVSAELATAGVMAGAVPWQLADPGATRTASTWQAIQALAAAVDPQPTDLVAVHDAARPFATAQLLAQLGEQAAVAGGAVPGVPVPDTIVSASGGPVNYLSRESLLAVQTPQVFQWQILVAAHRWAAEQGVSYTDDGGLLAAQGQPPVVVPGEVGNWKVTSAADLQRALDLLDG